ncbi:MAG TPA: sulfurtransferase TusA family protein [Bellilinea sp.]|nr:sulfurtransferase TusA family protein [Bellilinea sp.]
MSKNVDVRGLSCPEPLMLTSQAIDEGTFPIEVWVDSVTSRENIRRLASSRKLKISIRDTSVGYLIRLDKD